MMTIFFMVLLLGLAALIPPLRQNKFYLLNAALVMGLSYIVEKNYFKLSMENLLSYKTILLLAFFHLICINFVTFIAYGADKRAAQKHQWRVPEAHLHELEFLGGWIGAFIGQRFFHHKTAKKSFQHMYLLMILLEIAFVYIIIKHLGLDRFF